MIGVQALHIGSHLCNPSLCHHLTWATWICLCSLMQQYQCQPAMSAIRKIANTPHYKQRKVFKTGWILLLDQCSNNIASSRMAAGSRQQAAGSRQQAAGSRQQAAGSRQQAAGSRQQAAGSRQQAACSLDICSRQVCIQPPNVKHFNREYT